MIKKYFSVSGWHEFQHYKDRNPPWIKLHNQLLDNYEFECLTDATKGHLLCIWMLASRTNNKIIYDQAWVKRKIGANSTVDLKSLLSSGFIEVQGVEHDASKVLVSVEKSREETEENITSNDIDYSSLQMTNDDVLELRRIRKSNKGGKISQRVVNGLAKEFKLARLTGLNNDQILTEWETRGWKSFKAEWLRSSFNNQPDQNFNDDSTDWVHDNHGIII